jgi:hypothetical protein
MYKHIHCLAQIRLDLGFDCLCVKSHLSQYKQKGRQLLSIKRLVKTYLSIVSLPRLVLSLLSIQQQCLAICLVHGSRPVTILLLQCYFFIAIFTCYTNIRKRKGTQVFLGANGI